MIGSGKPLPSHVKSRGDILVQRSLALARQQAKFARKRGIPIPTLAKQTLSRLQSDYPGKRVPMSYNLAIANQSAYLALQQQQLQQAIANQQIQNQYNAVMNQMLIQTTTGGTAATSLYLTTNGYASPISTTSTSTMGTGGGTISSANMLALQQMMAAQSQSQARFVSGGGGGGVGVRQISARRGDLRRIPLYSRRMRFDPSIDAKDSKISTITVPADVMERSALDDDDIIDILKTVVKHGLTIEDGDRGEIHLPDGARIDVMENGAYFIEDKDSRVVYRANRVRDFNRYMNVSDRIEEFIAYCGTQGVQRHEMLDLPINLFISWLILHAARADKEPDPPEAKNLPAAISRAITPLCKACGKMVSRAMAHLELCGPACFTAAYAKIEASVETADQLLLPAPA